MRLRTVPRTPAHLRETQHREVPDEYRICSHETNWGELRFTVEARCAGRVLGDRSFADYPTAREHAAMNAKWDDACVTDFAQLIAQTSPSPEDTPHNTCERCGDQFEDSRTRVMRTMARKRFCSEQCRKRAESARGFERRKDRDQ